LIYSVKGELEAIIDPETGGRYAAYHGVQDLDFLPNGDHVAVVDGRLLLRTLTAGSLYLDSETLLLRTQKTHQAE
jgi:hypothetical protein